MRIFSLDVKTLNRLLAPAECPSHAQLGQDLLRDAVQISGIDAPAGLAILSVADQLQLVEQLADFNEDVMVALLTPILMRVCRDANSSCLLANSEKNKWIHTSSEMPVHFQAPDMHFSHIAALQPEKPPPGGTSKSAVEATRLRDPLFVFAGCEWPLRDAVACLFEAKVRISLADNVGEIFPKVQNMLRGSDRVTLRVCLFDPNCLYLLVFSSRTLHSYHRIRWIDDGSMAVLVNFLRDAALPPWCRALDLLCHAHEVKLVRSGSFLGAGACGFAFKVELGAANTGHCVLKLSKTAGTAHALELEALKIAAVRMKLLSDPSGQHLAALKILPSLSTIKHCDVGSDTAPSMFASVLIEPVGQRSLWYEARSTALFGELCAALAVLHKVGIYHGDPRLPNIIRLADNSVMWIDLASSRHELTTHELLTCDFLLLVQSFCDEASSTPLLPALTAMLPAYLDLVHQRRTFDEFMKNLAAQLPQH